jgi:CheY-like chemotaxis protein
MQELPKMQEMLKEALAQAASECGTLLGQQLEIRETTGREVTRDAYFNGMENASFVIGIESHEDYQGIFCLVLSFRDAIVLSGTLLGVPAARIMEKQKLAIIEPDDEDAFSEIANQVIGSFNAVFKRSLPKKTHLKKLSPKKFIPQQDPIDATEPVADGKYYLLQPQLSLAGKDFEQFDVLIPLHLATLFDLQMRSQEKPQESNIEAAPVEPTPESSPVVASGPTTVLILDDNATERQQFQDILAASGVTPVSASLDGDLKKLLSCEGLKAVLVGVHTTNDQDLSVCLKISANFKDISIPIIMCAREWTRSAVLKALKYGAGDIMLTPCSPDELTSKVLKLVNAPLVA